MLSVFLQASASQTLNPWQLVIGASPVVQLVMVILVFMTVMCLYIIGAKWIRLKQVTDQSRSFLELFWSEEKARNWNAKSLNEIHGRSARAFAHRDGVSSRVPGARAHCADGAAREGRRRQCGARPSAGPER